MRHLYNKVHLNRSRSHRKALLSNLSTELFLHRRIMTTLIKAKYARSFAERLITFAKRGSIADRRQVMRFIRNKEALKVLFSDLGPHFKNRDGGYTRIIKLGARRGDAAPLAILELVGFDDAVAAASTTKKKESKSRLKEAQQTVVESKEEEGQKTKVTKKKTQSRAKAKSKPEPEPVVDEEIVAVEEEPEKTSDEEEDTEPVEIEEDEETGTDKDEESKQE